MNALATRWQQCVSKANSRCSIGQTLLFALLLEHMMMSVKEATANSCARSHYSNFDIGWSCCSFRNIIIRPQWTLNKRSLVHIGRPPGCFEKHFGTNSAKKLSIESNCFHKITFTWLEGCFCCKIVPCVSTCRINLTKMHFKYPIVDTGEFILRWNMALVKLLAKVCKWFQMLYLICNFYRVSKLVPD